MSRNRWLREWHMPDWLVVTLVITGIVLGCVVLVFAVEYGPARWGCRNRAAQMGLPYSWSPTTDCLVEVNGRWYPIEQVQNVGGTLETT